MRIAEMSEKSGVSADTLRYYERVGLMPGVARTDSGIRDYSDVDMNRIEFIRCMRDAGVSIEALIEYMSLFEEGDSTVAARKAILEEQRDLVQARIDAMQAGLDRLNYKIDNYEHLISSYEPAMRREAGE